jgi:hypothetical protein
MATSFRTELSVSIRNLVKADTDLSLDKKLLLDVSNASCHFRHL